MEKGEALWTAGHPKERSRHQSDSDCYNAGRAVENSPGVVEQEEKQYVSTHNIDSTAKSPLTIREMA